MVETFIDTFTQFIPPWLTVLVLSMLPAVGLGGGFAAAVILGVPWEQAIALTVIGNIIPVPFILLFIRAVLELMHKVRGLDRIASLLEEKALRKITALAEKYPRQIMAGLFLFVVIPLPGSGAWTGSLVAALMRLPVTRAFQVIAAGVVVSCIIMLVLAYAFPAAMGF